MGLVSFGLLEACQSMEVANDHYGGKVDSISGDVKSLLEGVFESSS